MYLEFILLITDYFQTLKFRTFLFDWCVPIVLSLLVFLLLYSGDSTTSVTTFKNNAISVLGILVGFSITIITILTTGQSRNLEEIKSHKTEIQIGKEKITLFRLLLINFTYSVVMEAVMIIVCLLYPILLENVSIAQSVKYIGFSILVLGVTHILLLTIRNLTDFYLILGAKK